MLYYFAGVIGLKGSLHCNTSDGRELLLFHWLVGNKAEKEIRFIRCGLFSVNPQDSWKVQVYFPLLS